MTEHPAPPLARRLDGLLFFPVTAFDAAGRFDAGAYRAHLDARLAEGPGAVFAACGTGEFPALAPDEYAAVLDTAVAAAGGRVPVVGGTGYGTALARAYARAAESCGADALLVLPPAGVDADQAGLLRHYTALAESTSLDLILYQRDQLAFTPDTVARLAQIPNIVGFKDGRGDLDLMLRIVSAVRTAGVEDFLFFNGMPTAEATQQAYRAIGVPLYSSAVFCFAPDLALAFHRALEQGDTATLTLLTDTFLRPYVELRRLRPGYAVSLVKAATRAAGHPVGEVRAPLSEPDPAHVATLLALLERTREALA
ncbi:5-dehydro-4-deoxyglucarate dehydratase [Streptacidiphilus melanogenes]|uniref:5-dehydro-4-deoxyglucarate dehydratase n=1 Tax=Streptacidiphilus melanogenes TaxID=411235 RepID=UPI0005AAFD1E|nr:5-dehydro-4-deoxyglucarate dehydratase [Streptacidiphilus melanogenes]